MASRNEAPPMRFSPPESGTASRKPSAAPGRSPPPGAGMNRTAWRLRTNATGSETSSPSLRPTKALGLTTRVRSSGSTASSVVSP